MVAKLEQRMRDQPNDFAGLADARHAPTWRSIAWMTPSLPTTMPTASTQQCRMPMLGLGEAMSLRAGGDITPEAAQLFEQAVTSAPDNPKALLYGGFAAAVRGDRAPARSRWQTLKNLHPPAQIDGDARCANRGTRACRCQRGGGPRPAGRGVARGARAPRRCAARGHCQYQRSRPRSKPRSTGDAPLFVFAREPGSRGPPLAAKRLTSSAIGTQIHLSSADSMMPGRVLSAGQRVSITARVSFSGQPLPAAGDLYGELSYDVGRDGVRNLVIDRVAE